MRLLIESEKDLNGSYRNPVMGYLMVEKIND